MEPRPAHPLDGSPLRERVRTPTTHDSAHQRATVTDRGAGFGDVYLYDHDGIVEARFCWTAAGQVWCHGYQLPSRSQRDRAVRALAELPVGRAALGLPDDFDPSRLPPAPSRPGAPGAGAASAELALAAAVDAAFAVASAITGPSDEATAVASRAVFEHSLASAGRFDGEWQHTAGTTVVRGHVTAADGTTVAVVRTSPS